jgi:hypothetical protein
VHKKYDDDDDLFQKIFFINKWNPSQNNEEYKIIFSKINVENATKKKNTKPPNKVASFYLSYG